MVGGLAGALGRAFWRRQDLKAGGESNRRARETLSVQALRGGERWRLKRNQDYVDAGCYAIGLDSRGGIVWRSLGQDLERACGTLEAAPELRAPTALAVDEFAAFGGPITSWVSSSAPAQLASRCC
ncbi:MAG: hypothetical protein ACRDL4_01225 [Thermoleophilaceae bacterium]